MSNGRIFYENAAQSATVTITTEATGYEKAYLTDENPSTKYRTTAITESIIKFTFTAAQRVRGVAVFGHNIVSGDTTWKFEASEDDFATTAQSVDLDKVAPCVEALDWNYMYFRIRAQKASGTYIEIAEVGLFLNDYEFLINYSWGYNAAPEVARSRLQSYGGNIFSKKIFSRQSFMLGFEFIGDTQKAAFVATNEEPLIVLMPDGIAGDVFLGEAIFSGFDHVAPAQWNVQMGFLESPA